MFVEVEYSMVVNASVTIYRLVDTAEPGMLVKLETLVKNTGDEEQDFRIAVSGIRSGLVAPTLFTVYSEGIEIKPNQEPFIYLYFTMPHESITVSVQPQWWDRTGIPNLWRNVGGVATRFVSIRGEPQVQVGLPSVPALTLQIPEWPWIVGGIAAAALIVTAVYLLTPKGT